MNYVLLTVFEMIPLRPLAHGSRAGTEAEKLPLVWNPLAPHPNSCHPQNSCNLFLL